MCTTYAAELVDQLLTRMLWSARAAAIAAPHVPDWMYGARAAAAALVLDHDRAHPDAPGEGEQRVASIVEHVLAVAADIATHREIHRAWVMAGGEGPEPVNPYRCPVASLNARAHGRPDPYLLARALDVLTYLPTLTAPDQATGRTTAGLIRELRAARSHDDLDDLTPYDDLDLP